MRNRMWYTVLESRDIFRHLSRKACSDGSNRFSSLLQNRVSSLAWRRRIHSPIIVPSLTSGMLGDLLPLPKLIPFLSCWGVNKILDLPIYQDTKLIIAFFLWVMLNKLLCGPLTNRKEYNFINTNINTNSAYWCNFSSIPDQFSECKIKYALHSFLPPQTRKMGLLSYQEQYVSPWRSCRLRKAEHKLKAATSSPSDSKLQIISKASRQSSFESCNRLMPCLHWVSCITHSITQAHHRFVYTYLFHKLILFRAGTEADKVHLLERPLPLENRTFRARLC